MVLGLFAVDKVEALRAVLSTVVEREARERCTLVSKLFA